MYILVTYDVDTTDKSGQRRLRRVAKACLDYVSGFKTLYSNVN